MSELIERIERRLKSSNSVPVDRTHITAEEWAELLKGFREQLEQAEQENERVRQANLDVMMHFEDMKAAKEQAEARVAELEEGLAGIENCAFGYQGCRQTAEEAANWCNSEATRLLDKSNRGWLLRKQAEAVVKASSYAHEELFQVGALCAESGAAMSAVMDYAQRLRAKAEEQEKGGGDE